jgi:tRNA-Thr(GGU) m(6)t(6)A37 methyltransferase TsaA
MTDAFTVRPIAYIRCPRIEPIDDFWGKIVSDIELAAELPEDSLDGLDEFSHLEIIYLFHKVAAEKLVTSARHPRSNPAWPKVGIFAQRAKGRPNRLGSTIVKLVARSGRRFQVLGLDAIDGTPVVDIKPVMAEFLPHDPVRQPAWSRELMRDYWRPDAERD